uniref:UDP-glycosyltransferase n=1 Tax=Photinus pyralis TaxID=7054 RepID=A0A1Y1JR85_PHOPY
MGYNSFARFLLLLCVQIKQHNGARILGIVPTPSYSHQVVFQPIWTELALRGHDLTVLTTDPMNNSSLPNLKEIDLGFAYDLWNVKHNFTHMIRTAPDSLLKFIDRYVEMVDDIVDHQLAHPEVKALITNKTEHFDLLMLEYPYPSLTTFSERFACPFIGMTSLDAHSNIYDAVGNPSHPVLNPDFSLPFGGSLNFRQRVLSLLFQTYTRLYVRMYSYPKLESQVRKHFGDGYPPLGDIAIKVSMLFVNVDPIFHNIRPILPAVVRIGGGTHLKAPRPLPSALQSYLDNATEGFVYFSLGSNVKSADIDLQLRNTLLAAFAELPYRVLWKFENEDLPGRPPNVYISKWFPQQDILRKFHTLMPCA